MFVNKLLQFPTPYITVTQKFWNDHAAIDFGWNSAYGGGNIDIYAACDGKILSVINGYGNTYPGGPNVYGNYIIIDHGNNDFSLSAHLLNQSNTVKAGDTVKRGQKIARMNNSGWSTGNHLHFELRQGGNLQSKRVDPLKYLLVFPGQIVSAQTGERDRILYYTPPAPIGTPVTRDTTANQLEVLISDLRARKRPELNDAVVLGFITKGVYNALTSRDMTSELSNGYLWYEVEKDLWIAYPRIGDPKWAVYLPASGATVDPPPIDPPDIGKDEEIAALKKQTAAYKAALDTIGDIVKQASA